MKGQQETSTGFTEPRQRSKPHLHQRVRADTPHNTSGPSFLVIKSAQESSTKTNCVPAPESFASQRLHGLRGFSPLQQAKIPIHYEVSHAWASSPLTKDIMSEHHTLHRERWCLPHELQCPDM